jgi:ATP-dependent helicase/nuclease subunit A
MTLPLDDRFDDEAARERILTDLDTNMLVEAGAGSGKTTLLVGRILSLIARGTPVDRIAAVTFTRKAATELRERLQLGLERRAREEPAGSEAAARAARARAELDRAFVGTIHAFCGRLLREHPLELGLDPGFEELTEGSWQELVDGFWRSWVERGRRDGDPTLEALVRVGIEPHRLGEAFARFLIYPDVELPASEVDPPDIATCRAAVEAWLTEAHELLPPEEPAGGWDDLMRAIWRLELSRSIDDWRDVRFFCRAMEKLKPSHCKVVQKRWSDSKDGKERAKRLAEEARALVAGPIAAVLRQWREHRYPLVLRVFARAAEELTRERLVTGRVSFEDLLLLAARLLREHPAVRRELGSRYAHLLVDEFQDTDPIQAEVCFLLASDPTDGPDWRTVTPRPGSLFVVGDPKQSIYRFRRADIQTYDLVKQRLRACGAVLALTRNFRSVRAIEELVNAHFVHVFPDGGTPRQAAFHPMRTVKTGEGSDGVYRYVIEPPAGRRGASAIRGVDAETVASWIAARVAAGERRPGDFLILTPTKAPVAQYARVLAERNIPVATAGATLPQERELTELVVVLRAMADPENPVAVAAALEGLFFGLAPADLFDARQAGVRFRLTQPPGTDPLPAVRALARLHAWWRLAERHPADVVVERILNETGLLIHAAGQPLGDVRAGTLLHLVEVLRASGASGIPEAIACIERLLEAEAPEALPWPAPEDAVRVMNVHKAKGLEAEVVVLADPSDFDPPGPWVHVQRGSDGRATGGMCIVVDGEPVAEPLDWERMVEAERAFEEAERARLLYVAVTRARRELVIAQCARSDGASSASAWAPLDRALDALATPLNLAVAPAPGRRQAVGELEALAAAIAHADSRRQRAAEPSLVVSTVTESAKGDVEHWPARRAADASADGARVAWGRAVHRALEALGRGRRGRSLEGFLDAVARAEGLTAHQRIALGAVIRAAERSGLWQYLAEGDIVRVELPVMHCERDGTRTILTEGVIDMTARTPDGWRVVDWKTDDVDEQTWQARLRQYTRQVERYAEILRALTGECVAAQIERIRPAVGGSS